MILTRIKRKTRKYLESDLDIVNADTPIWQFLFLSLVIRIYPYYPKF